MVPVQTSANPATCSPVRACWLRAWDRAKTEKLIPYRETATTWAVKTYTITVTGAGWSDLSCSCPAGRSGRICKHAAVVAKAIVAHVLPVRGTEKTGKEVAIPAALSPAILSLNVATPLDALYA